MATLKSIKNKYLTTSDGGALGVTANTENVSLLSFKLATADSLSKFNLVDGFSDDYQDTSGVDASTSSGETRDSSGKYYSGTSTTPQNPTGGTVTTYTYNSVDYTLNTFTADGTFAAPSSGAVDILMVAGGGGGAGGAGVGGGGAGGFKYYSQATAASGNSAVVVGDGGGAGAPYGGAGADGDDSSFSTLTATGGGGGAAGSGATGGAGGSGGGGTRQNGPGGAGSANQGSNGGQGGSNSSMSFNAGGGGGGASAVGSNAGTHAGGSGGGGYTEGATVYDWQAATGTVTLPTNFQNGSTNSNYAGGGGGGGRNGGDGGGGTGGGGSGGSGGDGTDGKGGGGGGWGGTGDGPGGDGGNGIVIVRYVDDTFTSTSYNNMTIESNAFTAQAAPTTARIIMDEYTSTGSATLNTDIKAYASRDSGTTYTQVTLADLGTISTNHRILSGSVDISGQPSGTSVKYKVETLNQGSGKQTRVYATSMAWA